MARRPRQIAHKVQQLTTSGAAMTSAAATGEAAPGIDTHIQALDETAPPAITSAAGTAETVATPTNQMQVTSVSGAAYTSS